MEKNDSTRAGGVPIGAPWETSVTPIALGFVLGIIPFALWTWWMLRQEHNAHAPGFATSPGHVSQLLVAEPSRRAARVRPGRSVGSPERSGSPRPARHWCARHRPRASTTLAARADRSLTSPSPAGHLSLPRRRSVDARATKPGRHLSLTRHAAPQAHLGTWGHDDGRITTISEVGLVSDETPTGETEPAATPAAEPAPPSEPVAPSADTVGPAGLPAAGRRRAGGRRASHPEPVTAEPVTAEPVTAEPVTAAAAPPPTAEPPRFRSRRSPPRRPRPNGAAASCSPPGWRSWSRYC